VIPDMVPISQAAVPYDAAYVERLQKIEVAAMRVASSRDANGIVTDVRVLDRLDRSLEARS